MPDLRADLLVQHVAEDIGAARDADTDIEIDIRPNLTHPERRRPIDIRDRLVPDCLFETVTLADLERLVAAVEEAILRGATEETIYDASPENASDGGWTHRTRDGQTCDLLRALSVMDDLRDRLQAVQDLLAARRVLERMNAEHDHGSEAGTPPPGHAGEPSCCTHAGVPETQECPYVPSAENGGKEPSSAVCPRSPRLQTH